MLEDFNCSMVQGPHHVIGRSLPSAVCQPTQANAKITMPIHEKPIEGRTKPMPIIPAGRLDGRVGTSSHLIFIDQREHRSVLLGAT